MLPICKINFTCILINKSKKKLQLKKIIFKLEVMEHKLSTRSHNQQKSFPVQKNVLKEQQMLHMYQIRMKSLMQIVKIYQENIQIDDQNGALSFMKTPQMAKYRIDRQFQILKDVLLIQKQKLVIKVLTSCHELKKQNQNLKRQASNIKFHPISHDKSEQNIAEKDANSNISIQKQANSFNTKNVQKGNHSNSRISILSHFGQQTSPSNISIYEKLLQDKLTLIKQLQKKNKQLGQQNQQYFKKINQITSKLQQSRILQSKQCSLCKQLRQTVQKQADQLKILKNESQRFKLKLKQEESVKMVKQQQLKLKDIRIKEFQVKFQSLMKQMFLKQQTYLKEKQNLSKATKKSPKQQNNLETIKQLKDQIITLEQQLMKISNSFNFIKEDISESLRNQIKKLKNYQTFLKQNIKSCLSNIKSQMLQWVAQMLQTVQLKYESKKNQDDLMKRLRILDNEIDFFIEQKHIQA